jgi:hypothetical protein
MYYQKTGLLHTAETYQKYGNGAVTSVGSTMKCDDVAVIISQPVFHKSQYHF